MSQAIQWIKSNVLIVVCLGVIVVSMLSLLWPTAGVGASLRDQIAERERAKREGQSYLSQSVRIPSPNPGEPPRTVNITVNAAAVAELQRIFSDMNDGYRELEAEVVAFNQNGPSNTNPHVPMLDGLFPKASADSKLFDARSEYKQALVSLYQSLANQSFGPGQPPTEAEIKAMFDRVKAGFAADVIGADLENNPQLNELLARKQVEFYLSRASKISIYCTPTQLIGDQLVPGVFHVGDWAQRTDRPTMSEIWEGQMDLWMQQDLINAVRVANFSDTTASVLGLPVKRILNIQVVPGYVGLVKRSSIAVDRPRRGSSTSTLPEAVTADDLDEPLRRDFRVSPTGRRSNSLYDVRHATISVIVDARQIPKLLNAFGQVNLMTPIVQQISKVDQAAHLAEGYVYGDGVDVVQVDLLVETLWMRDWTAGHATAEAAEQKGEPFNPGLMPDPIRYELSLPTRDPNYTPAEDTTDGTMPGRFPGQDGRFPGPDRGFPDENLR